MTQFLSLMRKGSYWFVVVAVDVVNADDAVDANTKHKREDIDSFTWINRKRLVFSCCVSVSSFVPSTLKPLYNTV